MEEINKGGRPKKEIDQELFEKLCAIQCTKDEICDVFSINEKTLTRWCEETYGMGYYDVFSIKRNAGKSSLRRMQWKLAEVNPTMAIFLGKQYLDQKDKHETEISGGLGIEIKWDE